MSMFVHRKKRDKVDRAFVQGYKSGLKGHEMESCPYFESQTRGSWFAGWREGRSNYLSGFVIYPELPPSHQEFMNTNNSIYSNRAYQNIP